MGATDPAPCVFVTGICEVCEGGAVDGTGFVVLYDADGDNVCDADEVVGCQDPSACNWNFMATDSDPSLCVFATQICETCSGDIDGTGTVVDNDADDDGICNADEVVGCQDVTACNYDFLATDAGTCIYATGCETCSGEFDGTGVVVDNDADNDGVCDADEIAGCQDSSACNYNALATDDDGSCLIVSGCDYCEFQMEPSIESFTISNAPDPAANGCYTWDGTFTDSPNPFGAHVNEDGDYFVWEAEGAVLGNNSNAIIAFTFDIIVEVNQDEPIEFSYPVTWSNGMTQISGCSSQWVLVDGDTDDDGICDVDEIAGCQDPAACNYNATATDDDGTCLIVSGCDYCEFQVDPTRIKKESKHRRVDGQAAIVVSAKGGIPLRPRVAILVQRLIELDNGRFAPRMWLHVSILEWAPKVVFEIF
ncbi:MAG: hypothetical protein AAF193_08550, partial [Bacteroidota bacterium]